MLISLDPRCLSRGAMLWRGPRRCFVARQNRGALIWRASLDIESMYEFLRRVHYYLLSKKLLGIVYGCGHRLCLRLRSTYKDIVFRKFGIRPALNADSISRILDRYTDDSPGKSTVDKVSVVAGLKMIAHVAFHLDKSRFAYVVEVANQLRRIPVERLDIFIDSNKDETASLMDSFGVTAEVCLAEDLDHPYKLTWAHREHMRARLDDYDVFMYVEDDIFIPAATFSYWLAEKERLKKHGFLPGFLRVELDRAGRVMASDYEAHVSRDKIIELDNRKYLATHRPYQACWLYDKEMMEQFVGSDSFQSGYEGYVKIGSIRENAAIGMAYHAPPEGFSSRHLLALNERGEISSETFVFHLPSNYGRRRVPADSGLATIAVSDLFV